MTGPKPPGALVKLRVAWGDPPPCPCTLVLPSGRRYLVTGVNGKTLHCVVMSSADDFTGPVLTWEWAKREKTRRRGSLAREIATMQADVPPVRIINWSRLLPPPEGESNLLRAFRKLGVKPKLTP